jgi:glycosyltransferase involved in cell wall biosynthesis
MKSNPPHILLLNQYYPPDTAATARMAALVAKTLAERYRVTVLTGRPSYDPTEYHPYYVRRREAVDNLVVERMGSTHYHRHRMRRRIVNYLSYLSLAVPRALTIDADVVLSMTDPPIAGIAGALVARLKRKPFVYNIRDLYPDMALAGNIVQPARWVDAWEQLHRWVLRQADVIIVLGEDMRERVIGKGVDPNRVVVVRDGAPVPSATATPDHPVVQEIRCGFPFVLLHAGNLGFYGAWEALIGATRLLSGGDIGLVFVGDGAAKPRIEALASGCDRVRFLPFRPLAEVSYVLAAADIHVVTIRRGLEGVVVPSKLYPILAAGRPVLAVAPERSDVARIVTRHGCGLVASPDEPALVAESIQSLARDRVGLEQMAGRARAVAPEYERAKQLERFVRLIEQVAAS